MAAILVAILDNKCCTTAFATAICIFINYKQSLLFWYIETLVYRHRPLCGRNRPEIPMNLQHYIHMTIIMRVTEHHHVLACFKPYYYIKTQLLNDQIRSKVTRNNVSTICILMIFLKKWNSREHFENNVL